ncbi:MAG TPA: triose-phosphate isomerase [Candidatus Limnocylindrales bacterium]|nr:triose-phosphate isomerase [Candidatus Limnocylindrales bacterium]
MRTPLLAGNWKLQPATRDDARRLAKAVADGCRDLSGREVMLAPPFTALCDVVDSVAGSPVGVGAQDLYWEKSGAFTGEISGPMLADTGCRYAIVGHSERRQFFGETDYTVAKKAAAAFVAGLIPVVCVGETLAQRDAGETMTVVETQVRHGLVELSADALQILVIAYEPVWAIGTGRTATPEQAEEVHARIRRVLREASPDGIADKVRILYGGSVKPGNIDEIMACPNVDGALVGGASLVAEDFLRIVHFEESSL